MQIPTRGEMSKLKLKVGEGEGDGEVKRMEKRERKMAGDDCFSTNVKYGEGNHLHGL